MKIWSRWTRLVSLLLTHHWWLNRKLSREYLHLLNWNGNKFIAAILQCCPRSCMHWSEIVDCFQCRQYKLSDDRIQIEVNVWLHLQPGNKISLWNHQPVWLPNNPFDSFSTLSSNHSIHVHLPEYDHGSIHQLSVPVRWSGPFQCFSGYDSMIRGLNHTVWRVIKRSFLYTVVIQFDIMPLPISTSNIPLLIYRITIVFWRLISSKIFLKWFWSSYETYKFWRFIRKLFLNLVTKSFQN